MTLCAIDCVNPVHALLALDISLTTMAFGDAVFLSDSASKYHLAGVRMVPIPRIDSTEAYSRLVLKELGRHFTTSHLLLVQWDGHVLDASAWREEFLAYDFIGAPWGGHVDGHRIGNGGFSLRSRRLFDALLDPDITELDPEDVAIGRRYRPLLESRHGIRFPSESLAAAFSFETTYPDSATFGFHGLFNMWMVIPPEELGRFVRELAPRTVAGPQYLKLAHNYWDMGRHEEAIVALENRVQRNPSDQESSALLAQWKAIARPPVAPKPQPQPTAEQTRAPGRNDPCPCGSGRRFKACCGSLGAAAQAPDAAPISEARFDPQALLDQAMALHKAGELAKAENVYQRVLAVSPDNIVATQYLGVLLLQKGDPVAAESLVRRALARADDVPEFHSNLGLCLRAQGRLEEAVACYRRAIALRPGYAGAFSNLGLDLQALGRVEHAVAAFEDAVSADPTLAEAHWNLGLARLLLGRFAQGWPEYEWRMQCQAFEGGRLKLPGASPWQGEPLAGRTLLVRQEQGAGDTIQMLRFVPPLVRSAKHVIVEAAPELASLVEAAAPGATVVMRNEWRDPVDFYVNLMSLPFRRGLALEQLPFATRYLQARPEAVAMHRQRLAGCPSRRVGLVWAGNPGHANDRNRSCPPSALEPLLGVEGCTWLSLQKGPPMPAAWRGRVQDLSGDLNDFSDTAAVLEAIDLLVTVDTSVAHLAGAMGRPVWLLLPFAPDWRWLLEREDSPWYPGMRLFRQPRPGDWGAVVGSVRSALEGSGRS